MSIANTKSETIVEAGIIEDNDQVYARIEHLKELENLVGNSYPNKFVRSFVVYKIESEREENKDKEIQKLEDTVSRIKECDEIDNLIPHLSEGEKPAPEVKEEINRKLKAFGNVRIAGRLATPPRTMGKAAFVHLSDGVKRLQIYVRRDDVKGISNDGAMSEPSAVADGSNVDDSNAEGNPPATAGSSDTVNGWEMFKLFDHGDFVGVEGFLFLTNTGELSVHVERLQFLAKAMLPMPDKIHGISDPELQRRFRYADLIADSLKIDHAENELTTRQVFERRAKLISGMRRFLDDAGFIEVETPMLTPKATGAAARAFETFHEALKIPLYARIAPELYLKRLTVGGFEKVYELNRNFRNEGLSQKHNPEFTMLEFYCAYMDVNGMMDFGEAMIKESVRKATGGSLQVKYGDNNIDFSKFERLTMKEAIARHWRFQNLNNEVFDSEWLNDSSRLKRLHIFDALLHAVKVSPTLIAADGRHDMEWHRNRRAEFEKRIEDERKDEIWEKSLDFLNRVPTEQEAEDLGIESFAYAGLNFAYERLNEISSDERKDAFIIEKFFEDFAEAEVGVFKKEVGETLIQPTFIIDYPKSISPLSKASPENPNVAERFELFINGMECANGFSELNDPQEQYERFREQTRERETGDDEAMVMDEDYIRALSYGMPPAAGIGIGIDRLVMLLTNRHSIRDVILFPHMRPERREQEEKEAEASPVNPS